MNFSWSSGGTPSVFCQHIGSLIPEDAHVGLHPPQFDFLPPSLISATVLTTFCRRRDLAFPVLPAFLTAAMAAFESARIRILCSLRCRAMAKPPAIPATSPSHTVAIPHSTSTSAPPELTKYAPPPAFPLSIGRVTVTCRLLCKVLVLARAVIEDSKVGAGEGAGKRGGYML